MLRNESRVIDMVVRARRSLMILHFGIFPDFTDCEGGGSCDGGRRAR